MIKNGKWRDMMALYLFIHLVLVDALMTVLAGGVLYHHTVLLGKSAPLWTYVVVAVQVATFTWIVVVLFVELRNWMYRQWRLR